MNLLYRGDRGHDGGHTRGISSGATFWSSLHRTLSIVAFNEVEKVNLVRAAVGMTMAADDGSSVAVKGYEKLELSTGRCDGIKTATRGEGCTYAKSTTELAVGKAGLSNLQQGTQELQRRGVSQAS